MLKKMAKEQFALCSPRRGGGDEVQVVVVLQELYVCSADQGRMAASVVQLDFATGTKEQMAESSWYKQSKNLLNGH